MLTTLKYMKNIDVSVGVASWIYTSCVAKYTVAVVRKAVIKAQFLAGVYMLESSKHLFSNKTVSPTCSVCQLYVEGIHHTVTSCPAFYSI